MNLELFFTITVAVTTGLILATYAVRAIDIYGTKLLNYIDGKRFANAVFMFIAGACLIFALSNAKPANAASMTCTNCSLNLVQMLEYITGIEDLAYQAESIAEAYTQTTQQIEMVRQNFEQLQVMYKNLQQLPEYARTALAGDLDRLANLTLRLNTYRGDMESLGEIFGTLFPGQSEYEEWDNPTYNAKWDEWSKTVDTAAKSTFQLSGAQLEEMSQDSGKMQDHINNLLNSPEGQMQAIQAGNNLAAIQVQEARQFRELMATSIQSDLTSQMKGEAESQKRQSEWRKATNTDALKDITGKNSQPIKF